MKNFLLQIVFFLLFTSGVVAFENERTQHCLEVLEKDYPELLHHLHTKEYSKYFSKVYRMKVVGDLQRRFGKLKKLHICEIATEHFLELCELISTIDGYKSYTLLVPAKEVATVSKQLKAQDLSKVKLYAIESFQEIPSCDLLVCSDDLTALEPRLQTRCFEEWMPRIKNGYFPVHLTHLACTLPKALQLFLQQGKEGFVCMDDSLVNLERRIFIWREPKTIFPDNTLCVEPKSSPQGITYTFSGGRFGDNLISYMHAKWVSLLRKKPLYYREFEFSDKLVLDDLECHQSSMFAHETKKIRSWNDFNIKGPIRFVIPFFPETPFEIERYKGTHRYPFWFYLDGEDLRFRQTLKRLLTPKKAIPRLHLPKNKVTVALHVRRGGNVDPSNAYKSFPVKFPPDEFYIEQLKIVAEMYKDRELYVYLFTDDLNPGAIAADYIYRINNPRLSFDWRHTENSPQLNVVEDFCALQQFDCLIRPMSNFSIMAGLVSESEIIIYPTDPTENARGIKGVEMRFRSRHSLKALGEDRIHPR